MQHIDDKIFIDKQYLLTNDEDLNNKLQDTNIFTFNSAHYVNDLPIHIRLCDGGRYNIAISVKRHIGAFNITAATLQEGISKLITKYNKNIYTTNNNWTNRLHNGCNLIIHENITHADIDIVNKYNYNKIEIGTLFHELQYIVTFTKYLYVYDLFVQINNLTINIKNHYLCDADKKAKITYDTSKTICLNSIFNSGTYSNVDNISLVIDRKSRMNISCFPNYILYINSNDKFYNPNMKDYPLYSFLSNADTTMLKPRPKLLLNHIADMKRFGNTKPSIS